MYEDMYEGTEYITSIYQVLDKLVLSHESLQGQNFGFISFVIP